MESVFILLPIAVLLTGLGIGALFWAVNNRQYDDLDAAAESILFDEDANESVDSEDEQRVTGND